MRDQGRAFSEPPKMMASDDAATTSSSKIGGVAGDLPLQAKAKFRTIEWSELTGINFLRHGTGTTLYSAFWSVEDEEDENADGASAPAPGLGPPVKKYTLKAVVLKCPQWGLSVAHTNEVTGELKHEAEMLARLNHPNIISLAGIGQVPLRDGSSVYFLAVPLLAGGVLSDRLNGGAATNQYNDTSASHRQAATLAMSTLASPGGGEVPLNQGLPKGFRRRSSFSASSAAAAAASPGKLANGAVVVPAASKKMSYATILRVAEELASSLRYLHDMADESGVILHRDLKPDNIGFGEDDHVLLFDFGLVTSIPRSALSNPATPARSNPTTPRASAEGKEAEGNQAEGKEGEGKVAEGKEGEGKDGEGKDGEGKEEAKQPFGGPKVGSWTEGKTPDEPRAPALVSPSPLAPALVTPSLVAGSGVLPPLPKTPDPNGGAAPGPLSKVTYFRLPKYRLTGHTGSVRYMAPEVALDKPYNQSVDTYSFAIIFWEMVFCKRPFATMNVDSHREQVCLRGVRPPVDKKVPADLAELLHVCWHADSDRRPTFAAIEQRLRAMRDATPDPASFPKIEGRNTPSPNSSSRESGGGNNGPSWGQRASKLLGRGNASSSSSWF